VPGCVERHDERQELLVGQGFLEQGGEQVVAERVAAFGEELLDVRREALARVETPGHRVVRDGHAEQRGGGLRQLGEERAVGVGHAEQLGDDLRRQRVGDRQQIAVELVEQVFGETLDPRPEVGDAAPCPCSAGVMADPCVVGRVEEVDAVAELGPSRRSFRQHLAEPSPDGAARGGGGTQDGRRLVVAGDAPRAAVAASDGRFGPLRGVQRERIGDLVNRGRIELHEDSPAPPFGSALGEEDVESCRPAGGHPRE
jgi:hypothetical protein